MACLCFGRLGCWTSANEDVDVAEGVDVVRVESRQVHTCDCKVFTLMDDKERGLLYDIRLILGSSRPRRWDPLYTAVEYFMRNAIQLFNVDFTNRNVFHVPSSRRQTNERVCAASRFLNVEKNVQASMAFGPGPI